MVMELERAQEMAEAVVWQLSPYCQRLVVAGSIRRGKPQVNDIDLVLIPTDLWNLIRNNGAGAGQDERQ